MNDTIILHYSAQDIDYTLEQLENLILTGLLDENQLEKIQIGLKFLFKETDEFKSYWDALMPTERIEEELNGTLFSPLWPFCPFFGFSTTDPVVAFLMLSVNEQNEPTWLSPVEIDSSRKNFIDLRR